MKPLLLDLFHRHIGLAFHRQLQFADWLESQSNDGRWQHTVSTAELVMGGTLTFEAPYLGSYAEGDHTWLWAWDNPQLTMPEVGIKLAKRVKGLTKKTGCAAFQAEGLLDADHLFGELVSEHAAHAMASIVCGLLKYDAYYTIPFSGGRGVVVFHEPALREPDPHPTLTMTSRFSQLISAMPIPDQRAAFLGYAIDLGLDIVESGRTITGTLTSAGEVLAEFDNLNRLTKLESVNQPRSGEGEASASPRTQPKPRGTKGPPNPRPKHKPRPK